MTETTLGAASGCTGRPYPTPSIPYPPESDQSETQRSKDNLARAPRAAKVAYRSLPRRVEAAHRAPSSRRTKASAAATLEAVVRTAAEGERAVAALGRALIAEGYVPFDRELSVIGVRAAEGSRVCYPLTENHHRGGILRASWAPAPGLDRALIRTAERYAVLLMDRLEYVGVLAIELFESGERLVANEVAPRVHNSGHWTLDGAQASQFENHVRAVTGLELVVPRVPAPVAMLNIIGEMPEVTALAALPGSHPHLYDKDPRPGRKLGHVNVVGATRETLTASVDRLEDLFQSATTRQPDPT